MTRVRWSRSALRGRTSVLGLLLAAGLLALVASGQPWWRALSLEIAREPAELTAVNFSGTDATGGLSQALALVVLAGVLLTLVLAARGRRVLAALLTLAGLGVTALGAARLPPSAAAVRTRFRSLSLVEQFALDSTAWTWVYAAAGVGVVVGAAWLWAAAPHWPQRGRRFEWRPAAADPSQAWDVLDAGLDPTVLDPTLRDPRLGEKDDTPGRNDPDVRTGGSTDTMAEQRNSGAGRSSDPGNGFARGSPPAAQRRNEEQ